MYIHESLISEELFNAFKGKKRPELRINNMYPLEKINEYTNKLNADQHKSEIRFINHFENNKDFNMLRLYRNFPVENRYFPDFVDLNRQIIIEVDGTIHLRPDIQEKDSTRENKLKKAGWYVIRLKTSQTNEEWTEILKESLTKAFDSFKYREKNKRIRAAILRFIQQDKMIRARNSDDQNKAATAMLK